MKLKESDLCKIFVKGVKERRAWKYYNTDFEIIHIPNERIAVRDKKLQYGYLKSQAAMGMFLGAPDYLIITPHICAAIEFKRDNTCKLTAGQKHFKSRWMGLGLPYLCTYNVDEAWGFVELVTKL